MPTIIGETAPPIENSDWPNKRTLECGDLSPLSFVFVLSHKFKTIDWFPF
jgi:hypothetical protein